MALPLVAASGWLAARIAVAKGAAAIAGNSIQLAGAVALGSTVSSMMTATNRSTVYTANRARPNLVPDPETLIRLMYAGKLTRREAEPLLRDHGIEWPVEGATLARQLAWDEAVKLAQPTFALEQWRHWARQGRVDPSIALDWIKQAGFFDPVTQSLFIDDYEPLTIAQILALVLNQTITPDEGERRAKIVGFRREEWLELYDGLRATLNTGDLMTLRNRGVFSSVGVNAQLERQGLWGMEPYFDVLRHPILPPSDLVHLAVKEAWDQDVVNRFGYDEEFPAKFHEFMMQQGLGGGDPIVLPGGQVIQPEPWDRLIWRGHWATLAPGHAAEFLHRVREDTVAALRASHNLPNLRVFSSADYQSALKINDQPPAYREWFEAVSYRVLRLVDIRRAMILRSRGSITTDVGTRAWAISAWRDGGQTEANANALADLAEGAERDRINERKMRRLEKLKEARAKDILDGFESGYLLQPSVEDALRAMDWTDQSIEIAIFNRRYQLATETAKLGVRRAQSDWMVGRVNETDVRRRLALLGLVPDYIDMLLVRWKNMRGERRLMATAARLVDWFKRGLLPMADVTARLFNLGWSTIDAGLLLASATQDVLKIQAKGVLAAVKADRAAAAELEQVIRQGQALAEKQRAELRRLTPVSTIGRWYVSDDVSRAWVIERMTAMGTPLDIIDKHLVEWDEKKTAAAT